MAIWTGQRDAPEYGVVNVSPGKDWSLTYTPNQRGLEIAQALDPDFAAPAQPMLLAKAISGSATLEVYPRNVTSTTKLFEPKYEHLKTLRFEGFQVWSADDIGDAESTLSNLPKGFIRSPQAGFGIDWELRPIIHTLDDLGVETLVIRSGRHNDLPILNGTTYVMSAKQFDELRRAVRRVHDKALDLAFEEKMRTAHNVLLTMVDPVLYPEEPPIYREGGVTAIIASRPGDQLSSGDQKAVIAAATAAVKPSLKREPKALLQLSREIETVTLRDLIGRFQALLDADVTEPRWQSFFRDNPFILRLAFGYPVVQMGDQVSVGGGTFEGVGNKIADFGVRAAQTGNLALIEIKTGRTPLLEPKAYRLNLYGPHRELAGGVNQVLDQVYQVQKSMAALKETSQDYLIEGFAVQALVIAGRSPTDRNEKKSFEIYRHSLRAVSVITFDEMLLKLTDLAEFLETSTTSSERDHGPAAKVPEVRMEDAAAELPAAASD